MEHSHSQSGRLSSGRDENRQTLGIVVCIELEPKPQANTKGDALTLGNSNSTCVEGTENRPQIVEPGTNNSVVHPVQDVQVSIVSIGELPEIVEPAGERQTQFR